MRVSVLCPSRGRPDHLRRSLQSLVQNASDFQSVEVLLMLDDDDAHNYDRLSSPFNGLLLVRPRGNGYADLHLKYNELASMARGDVLWLWNDDATMLTKGWDVFIHAASTKPYGTVGDNNWFPFINRQAHQTLGHFSMSAHCDTYLSEVFRPFPQLCAACSSVKISHGPLHDRTFMEASATWATTKPLFDSADVQRAIADDRLKIQAMVGG